MKFRAVPGTKIKVSEIGFGVWTLAVGNEHEREVRARHLIHYALDRGINFFETADSCAEGLAETLLGGILHEERSRVVIATKFGHDFYPHENFGDLLEENVGRLNFSPKYLRFACEKSLRRLKTDWIDFYQIHHPTMNAVLRDDLYAALEKLKKEGKILSWGAALGPAADWIEEGKLLMRLRQVPHLRIAFSLFDPEHGWELMRETEKKNTALFAAMPHLFGSRISEIRKSLEVFSFLTEGGRRTLAQAAIEFVLSHKKVLCAIADITEESQINEFAPTSECPDLSGAELDRIRKLYAQSELTRFRQAG